VKAKQLIVAMAIGTVVAASAAHATSRADYQVERGKTSVTSLQTSQDLANAFSAHAGGMVELKGAVSGIVTGQGIPAFYLRVDPEHQFKITEKQHDSDITLGQRLAVLARIPQSGMMLEGIRVMKDVQATAAVPATAPTATSESTTPESASAATPAPADASTQTVAPTPDPVPPTATSRKRVAARPHRNSKKTRYAGKHTRSMRVAKSKAGSSDRRVALFAGKIQQYNHGISKSTAGTIAKNVLQKSNKYGVDPRLVFALIAQESHFNPHAVSAAGAKGLGQLMPGTASRLGVYAPFDIGNNVDGTVRYLAQLLQKFGGVVEHALAAYNAGPGSVVRYGGVPPFGETKHYVRTISAHYHDLAVSAL